VLPDEGLEVDRVQSPSKSPAAEVDQRHTA